jgi:4-hydroxybenzoate polyprenyltransferase/phosphoserine phosphatase
MTFTVVLRRGIDLASDAEDADESGPARPREIERVLAVDLDGTLLRGDSLHEALVQLAVSRPHTLPGVFVHAVRGRAAFKQSLAALVVPAADAMPWDERVVAYVAAGQAAGRRVVLVTGASAATARGAADFLGIAEVLSTTDTVNLKGAAKRALLDTRFGAGQWDYLGDSASDIAVWAGAHTALAANATDAVLDAVRRSRRDITVVATRERATPRDWLRALRVHQWSKNLLLFLPALLAHRATLLADLSQTLGAFASFSLAASSVYLFNDLCDLPHDRRHATKRRRPLAAGRIRVIQAVAAIPVLGAASVLLALRLDPAFGLVLAGYLVVTTLYSTALKRVPIVDVVVLAGLYATRLAAGSAATGIPLSTWLIAFSLFAFLSLALAKRASELGQSTPGPTVDNGRGYRRSDLDTLTALGTSAAYTAVLVFALYLDSTATRALYTRPAVLWGMVPLLIFWFSRLWLLVRRAEVDDDPVIFALSDRTSWIVGALAAAVGIAAR